MKEIQRIAEGGGVTVRYLPDSQVALTGQLVDVERRLHGLRTVDQILGEPSEFVETGQGRRVTTTVRLRPLEVALPRWYERPGLILAWVGSGCGVVLTVAYSIQMILGAIAGLTTLILGVLVVLGLIVVVPKLLGGRKLSGTWKTD